CRRALCVARTRELELFCERLVVARAHRDESIVFFGPALQLDDETVESSIGRARLRLALEFAGWLDVGKREACERRRNAVRGACICQLLTLGQWLDAEVGVCTRALRRGVGFCARRLNRGGLNAIGSDVQNRLAQPILRPRRRIELDIDQPTALFACLSNVMRA